MTRQTPHKRQPTRGPAADIKPADLLRMLASTTTNPAAQHAILTSNLRLTGHLVSNLTLTPSTWQTLWDTGQTPRRTALANRPLTPTQIDCVIAHTRDRTTLVWMARWNELTPTQTSQLTCRNRTTEQLGREISTARADLANVPRRGGHPNTPVLGSERLDPDASPEDDHDDEYEHLLEAAVTRIERQLHGHDLATWETLIVLLGDNPTQTLDGVIRTAIALAHNPAENTTQAARENTTIAVSATPARRGDSARAPERT